MPLPPDDPPAEMQIVEPGDDPAEDPLKTSRDYPKEHAELLQGFVAAVAKLEEGGTLREALCASWKHIVVGFCVHRGLILVPAPNNALTVLSATASIRPNHIDSIRLGHSSRGVSSSVVRRVIASRRSERIENSSLSRAAFQTASLRDTDYSVMCAPVLDASRTAIEAVLYLQSRGGSVNAYSDADLGLLEAFVRVLEQLVHFQVKLERELIPATMGYKEIRDHVLRRAIEARFKEFHYDPKQTMRSLKLKVPSTFYRIVRQLGIKSRQQTIAELRAAAAAAAGPVEVTEPHHDDPDSHTDRTPHHPRVRD